MSDLKLEDDPDRVILEGAIVMVTAADFVLDNASRRRADADPAVQRRALVHDQHDGLTVNYHRDYPGGVTIRGGAHGGIALDGTITVSGDILVRHQPPLQASKQAVHHPGSAPGVAPYAVTLNLVALVRQLEEQVANLTERVAKLEGH